MQSNDHYNFDSLASSNTISVYALWLRNELEKRGYIPIATRKSTNNPCYSVFIYNDTKELQKEMRCIFLERTKWQYTQIKEQSK